MQAMRQCLNICPKLNQMLADSPDDIRRPRHRVSTVRVVLLKFNGGECDPLLDVITRQSVIFNRPDRLSRIYDPAVPKAVTPFRVRSQRRSAHPAVGPT